MTKEYIATKEDTETIWEAISYVWKPELDYIFKEKSRIKDTVVISYDSKHVYIFEYKKELKKIPHKINISEKHLKGWCTGIYFEELKPYLPKEVLEKSRNELPRISGPLLAPMVETQKNLERKNNAYTTKESYLATIVHEFGHVYYNSFKRWYFSDLEGNLLYMKNALKLFEGEDLIENIEIKLPADYSTSEIFAFCTDYAAASIFWPDHKKDLDVMHAQEIKEKIKEEENLDLDEEDSTLSDRRGGNHLRAVVIGRNLIDKYPNEWPNVLVNANCI